MTEAQYPSPAPTPSPPPNPTPPISTPSPGASTSHIPRDLPPGYHSPWRQPLYSWQYTPSLLTSSPTTTTNCFPSSSHPSSTRKRSRSVRPVTLTRTELLEYPSKRLRWLSPSTPTTYKNSSHRSSSSRKGSRSKRASTPNGTPNATTATASATPPNDASRPTPRAPSVRFIILVRHTDAKTPPAPREATPGPSQAAAQPPPPTAPIVVATMMPSQGNAGLCLPHFQDQRPCPQALTSPSLTVKKTWRWKTMAVKHPLLPNPLQSRLST